MKMASKNFRKCDFDACLPVSIQNWAIERAGACVRNGAFGDEEGLVWCAHNCHNRKLQDRWLVSPSCNDFSRLEGRSVRHKWWLTLTAVTTKMGSLRSGHRIEILKLYSQVENQYQSMSLWANGGQGRGWGYRVVLDNKYEKVNWCGSSLLIEFRAIRGRASKVLLTQWTDV